MTSPSVLVTAARFVAATPIVRCLHEAGVNVHAADSYKLAPALYSHALVTTPHVTPSPSGEPLRFVKAVADIVRQEGIDLVMPTFEEGFYLSNYADLIPAPVFAPPFPAICELHSKARFAQLCEELSLPIPRTTVASDRRQLREAIEGFDDFVARPAFSRGGMDYLTNHGPRAGERSIDDCEPTSENPWLVQEYVDGADACSFSVVRDGKIVLHCVYEPTIPAVGGWSVQFGSITDFGTYDKAARIAEHFHYNGCLSFDYRRTAASEDGFVMIECNPRASSGAFLTPEEWFSAAILNEPGALRMVEPGVRRQFDAYLLNPAVTKLPLGRIVHELFTTPDAFLSPGDVLPALCFLISRRHFSAVAKKEHIALGRAFLDDISWNGSPMPERRIRSN